MVDKIIDVKVRGLSGIGVSKRDQMVDRIEEQVYRNGDCIISMSGPYYMRATKGTMNGIVWTGWNSHSA